MDSNVYSTGAPAGLGALAAVVDELAVQDLDGLGDAVLAERVLELRGLVDRLEGQWLRTLAAGDGRGAAGADHGVPAGSTAAWLRHRLRMGAGTAAGVVRAAPGPHRGPPTGTAQCTRRVGMGAGTAAGVVRTARALHRGPLTGTAQVLAAGAISPAHAQVLAAGIHDLHAHLSAA